MKNLAELMARKFYESYKDIVFRRVTFSKTSLRPAVWQDCPPRDRLEWLEASKRVLADPEIIEELRNRAEGI